MQLVGEASWSDAASKAERLRTLTQSRGDLTQRIEILANELSVSSRTIYRWLSRFRRSGLQTSSLLKQKPNGGRGRGRLHPAVEEVIEEAVQMHYLCKQKRRISSLMREIRRICRRENLLPPSRGAVQRRIDSLDPTLAARMRHGPDIAQKMQPLRGRTPSKDRPLQTVQIDHTIGDIIIVDDEFGLPIGRPTITLAIDEYSRSIVGYLVSLEPPGALAAALCLHSAICDKSRLAVDLGSELTWPMSGCPEEVFVDNAAEFHSSFFTRGCAEYGIAVRYRTPGQKQQGGIVERVIGTLMKRLHELPGTTFSNPAERGYYRSERESAMTLRDLDRWITRFICGEYHLSIHSALQTSCLQRWNEGLEATGVPRAIEDPHRFLLSFLPYTQRRLGRHGIQWDQLVYFADVLRPLIVRSQANSQYKVVRDPRDISRIWLYEPEARTYFELPLRDLSRPQVTLWEHRAATKRIKAEGRASIDQDAIFRAIEDNRAEVEAARKRSMKNRRLRARRPPAVPVTPNTPNSGCMTPYDEECILPLDEVRLL